MTLIMHIESLSRTPVYEQIKEQIIKLVTIGVYKTDDQLPSIRKLAADLQLNFNTVKRAFSELEQDGVIYSIPGKGLYIKDADSVREKQQKVILSDVDDAVVLAKNAGIEKQAIQNKLDKIYSKGEQK